MRIEQHFGRWIVCGHIYSAEEIVAGQVWQSSGGGTVTVEGTEKFGDQTWVTYSWITNGEKMLYEKDSFSFQCRYCLVLENYEPT